MIMQRKILVIHGPNLNMLGRREPEIYGAQTLSGINQAMADHARGLNMVLTAFQSNHEGEIVEAIQAAPDEKFQGIIINPAAYTHTSVAIRDAVLLLELPVIEVHLSNIYKREAFRQRSMLSDVVSGQIAGFGANSYLLALNAMTGLFPKDGCRQNAEPE